ncbi:hypothetical protein [Niabella hibiscisoli]|uniref:hypothetical protein n=1 Tax=Niabella hibiscisoli TaxID=1825928 RepID=UPI001F0F012F|nr:hypothetical protein [Niabella hibiscisoli]MCH5719893.1 hypothetical protein [Niabella hibiscisoli]
MAKLKIKDIEGQAADVYALFKQGGCDLPSYIGAEPQRGKVAGIYILILLILFFIAGCFVFTGILNDVWTKVAILSTFFSGLSIIIVLHYNYKNVVLTILTGIAVLIIALLALQVYTPRDMAKKLKKPLKNSLTSNTNHVF